LNRKLKILLNYFLAPIIFLVLSWSLYHQIRQQPDIDMRWQHISANWNQWKFWLVMLLMLLNWGLEARKWQVLVHHLQPFNWWNAFKSVLSGCSITMLTPNRIGEYGGRILYLKAANRVKAISLTVVGSISQLLVTLLMGCAGLFYLRYISQSGRNELQVLPHFWGDVLIYLSMGVTIVLLLFYWRLGWLVRAIEKIPSFEKLVKYISILDELNNWRLLRIVSLSFVRYWVFILQYILLFEVLKVEIPIVACFWLITVFYLVMAIAPTIGFVELPIRVTALWTIVQQYSTNELGVGAAALGIWLINLVLPAIIGSILMLRIKIVKDSNE
jgi:hypothetical protein